MSLLTSRRVESVGKKVAAYSPELTVIHIGLVPHLILSSTEFLIMLIIFNHVQTF